MLYDTHCHLDFDSFGQDLDDVLARAEAAGVTRLTTIGAGRGAGHAQAAINIAKANADWITATVGVHPHDAQDVHEINDALIATLESLAQDPIVVAIGEVGLDFYYEHSPRQAQKEVFRKFIAMARRLKKPLVIHTRNAAEDTLEILRNENAKDVGGIIHCFSEDVAFARAALDLGFVCSFSGIVTFKNAVAIQEAATFVPDDAILVETDAPFLAPVPHRGKRNEPSLMTHTADFIANLRGIDSRAFAKITTLNACRVFGIADPLSP